MRTLAAMTLLAMIYAAPAAAQDKEDSGFDGPPRREAREGREGRERDSDRGPRRGPPNPMFEAIDTNGDQIISKVELRKAIAALQKLDADGDGNLSLAEVTPPRGPGGPDGQRRGPGGGPEAFVGRMLEFDKNGDGKLTPDEVPERAMEMLQGGDANQDGAIDRAELGEIAQNLGERFGRGGRGQRGPGGPGGRGNNPQDFVDRLMENDRNGDGILSPNEVPEQLGRMLQGSDANGDGGIDPKELALAIEKFQEQRGRGGPEGRGNRSYDRAGRGNRGPEGGRPERPEFE